jgi:primosomal protein N' (replication factor Y)
MAQFKISGTDKEKTRRHAQAVGDLCHAIKNSHPAQFGAVEILGPIEFLLAKIARRYRWQIILKSANVKSLQRFLHQVWFNDKKTVHNRLVNVALDVDPFFML